MTVLAIITTALSAFLLGRSSVRIQKKRGAANGGKSVKQKRGNLYPEITEDYRNFLSYDGSEQI